jgi:hypothetical protein
MKIRNIFGIGALALFLSCGSENSLKNYSGYVDLNGDGREDEVSFKERVYPKGAGASYELTARFLQEDSTYSSQRVLAKFNCKPLEFSLFDIDGDGDYDLLFAKGKSSYGDGHKVYVSYNDGNCNFGNPKEIPKEFRE